MTLAPVEHVQAQRAELRRRAQEFRTFMANAIAHPAVYFALDRRAQDNIHTLLEALNVVERLERELTAAAARRARDARQEPR